MDPGLEPLKDWIGRRETAHDRIAATLDRPAAEVPEGEPLPALWHGLYFLPPVPLPRRRWAGSPFEFRGPVRVGDAVERRSTIADVASFRFKAVRPTFDLNPFRLNDQPQPDGSVKLWAQDHEGGLTMDAVATLAGDPP